MQNKLIFSNEMGLNSLARQLQTDFPTYMSSVPFEGCKGHMTFLGCSAYAAHD